MNRQLRRAQERKANKLQNRDNYPSRDCEGAISSSLPSPDEAAIPNQSHVSPSQLSANRVNSQLSTGPRSETGKAKSSLNALKSGLTGHTVLLPSDDSALYEQHVRAYFEDFKPAGDRERVLVQAVADAQWRLSRIPALEMGIYAVARLEFKDMFQEEDAPVKAALIEAHTFLTYQRQLNNLSLQEVRLRRNYRKDLAELAELQANHAHRVTQAVKTVPRTTQAVVKSDPLPEIGFEFSSPTHLPIEELSEFTLDSDPLLEAA